MLTTVPFKSASGLDTPVTEVMHHGLIALPATATLADAAATMRDNNVHAVLITGTDGSPLGWVTSRGILHNHARDWTVGASAADAITQPAASVAPTATLADAMTALSRLAQATSSSAQPAPGRRPASSPTATWSRSWRHEERLKHDRRCGRPPRRRAQEQPAPIAGRVGVTSMPGSRDPRGARPQDSRGELTRLDRL